MAVLLLSVAPEVNIMSPSPSFASSVFFAAAIIFSERIPMPCSELALPKLPRMASVTASTVSAQGFVVAALSRYVIVILPFVRLLSYSHSDALYILYQYSTKSPV